MEPDPNELQVLIAKMHIYEALARYCRGADRQDVDMWLSAFHPDARIEHAGYDAPPAEFAQRSMEIMKDMVVSAHRLSNVLIEVNRDIANSEAYVDIVHQEKGEEHEDHLIGRYLDRFEKRGGKWRIAHRQVSLDWTRRQVANPSPWEPLARFMRAKLSKEDAVYTAPHLAGLYR